jgi:hypothetical protein
MCPRLHPPLCAPLPIKEIMLENSINDMVDNDNM